MAHPKEPSIRSILRKSVHSNRGRDLVQETHTFPRILPCIALIVLLLSPCSKILSLLLSWLPYTYYLKTLSHLPRSANSCPQIWLHLPSNPATLDLKSFCMSHSLATVILKMTTLPLKILRHLPCSLGYHKPESGDSQLLWQETWHCSWARGQPSSATLQQDGQPSWHLPGAAADCEVL